MGVCIALVLGLNVRVRRFEVLLSWLGVLGYAAIDAVAFAGEQTAPAALASAVLPALVIAAVQITRQNLWPASLNEPSTQQAVSEASLQKVTV